MSTNRSADAALTAADPSDMAGVLAGTPDQIARALADESFPAIPRRPAGREHRRVVVVGMGGSALPVDIFAGGFAGALRCPVEIVRSYGLPRGVGDDPLVVASVGVLGPYDTETMRTAIRELEAWLDENAGTWQRDGAVRRLMYERPSWLKGSRLYSEVQIPIRPVAIQ